MKTRISYDPDKAAWVSEILTADGWELEKRWNCRDVSCTSGFVSDTILDYLRRAQEHGDEIIFSDDYPIYKGGKP